mgnify:CR=1 FL=1
MGAFSSDSWFRVAQLRPRLRDHVRVSRQRFRGKPWYVVHDPASRRTHRIAPGAWWVASQLDGALCVDAAWQRALAQRIAPMAITALTEGSTADATRIMDLEPAEAA